MTKKLLSALLALVMLLACCASLAAAQSAEPVEITFLTYDAMKRDNGMTRFEHAVELYKDVAPNVTIRIDVQAENSSTDFLTKLDLLQLTGVTGDVIQIPSYREYAIRADQGFFYPIDELIAAEGISYDATYAYPTLVSGKSFGIPFEPGIYGIFINKNMLDAAGLELPKEGWTWDDYRTYAEKLTTGTGADTIYGSFMHSWSEFKREGLFNVVMDNPYVKEDGTSNLDSRYFGAWLQYMYDLENVYKCQTPYSDVKATGLHYRDMFMNGKVAMIPIGTWMIDTVLNQTDYPHDFETVFAPFPVFEDGKAGVTQGAASYFCIGAKTTPEKAQAAYDFMRWLSNEGSAALNVFPADKSGDFASVLTAKIGEKTALLDGQSVLDAWTSPNMVANIIGRDAALFSEIDAIYNSEAELFLLGSQDLATTLSNIQEQGNEILQAAQ